MTPSISVPWPTAEASYSPGLLEVGLFDLGALVAGGGPHEDLKAGGAEGAGQVDDPRDAADQQRAAAGGAGDAEPPDYRDRGQAVQGDGGDDASILRRLPDALCVVLTR